MKRKRLPQQPTLLLDEKLVNLVRFFQLIEDELAKPQKKVIYVSSMLGEQSAVEAMIVERLMWLFREQFPRSKFIWGNMKQMKTLPDAMPERLQRAVKRYKERSGL